MGYFNLSPKLIQDNKMHIVYPVNISESNAETDINSVHNLDSNTKTLDAACGAIWINRMDGCQEDAGFIHNSDRYSYVYRCPFFYNTLFIYKPESTIDEEGDMANIANYKFWSYGHMLTTYAYGSPHFTDHSLTETARFISNENANGKALLLYRLSTDVHIYDPLISSYYMDITAGSNRVKTFFYPSRLSAKYNIWPQMSAHKEDALRVNVDTMLKYLIDVDYASSRPKGYVDKFFDVDEDRISNDYWWQPKGNNTSWYNANSVDVFPSYLTIESNGQLNMRGSQSDYAEFLDRHDIDRICLNRLDSRTILSTEHDYRFDDVVKYHPYSLISMGDLTPYQGLVPPEKSRFISVISNAVTYAFLRNTSFVKVYTSDTKWISVPYQDRMWHIRGTGNDVTIPPYSSNGLYTAKYIAPLNVDHLVRQWNLRAVEKRALGRDGYEQRKNKVLFSDCPIMSYKSARSGIWRLYNSANMINSIRWDQDQNGKLIMHFENTADMLIDDVNQGKEIPAPPIVVEEEMDWVVDVKGAYNYTRGYYYYHELGTLHVSVGKRLGEIGVGTLPGGFSTTAWETIWLYSGDGTKITDAYSWTVRPNDGTINSVSYNGNSVMCYSGEPGNRSWSSTTVALANRKASSSVYPSVIYHDNDTQLWWESVDRLYKAEAEGFTKTYSSVYQGDDGEMHVSSFIAYVYESVNNDIRIYSTTENSGSDWILDSTDYGQSDLEEFEHDESCKVTRIKSGDGKNVYKFYVMLQDEADPTKFVKTLLVEDKWEYDPDIASNTHGVYQPDYKRFEKDIADQYDPAKLTRCMSKFSDKYVKTTSGEFIKVSNLYTARHTSDLRGLLYRAANFHSVKLYNTNQ